MKTYILEEPKKILVEEKEIPKLNENEVLIKISHVGICGSDIHLYDGTYSGPHKYPILFGHEWSGTIFGVGSAVKGLKPGDRVTGDCSRYCDNCDYCRQDKNLCRHIEKYGITLDGASAEFIVRDSKYIYKAPDELDFDLICLSEPMAVAAHLVNKIMRADFVPESFLILGGGSIGIAALMLLKKFYHCEKVYLFDIDENRRTFAQSVGAQIPDEHLMEDSEIDWSNYTSLYQNAHFDAVIETTGNEKAFQSALRLVKPLGIVGCVGMMPEARIIQKLIVMKALTILGSIGGTGEFEFILDFMKKNRDYVRKMISHILPFEKYDEAFSISKNISMSRKVELRF
ncbi:MAG TPA: alcohol dehydrogenase catalytic domain-containing protein [Thermoanaerobacterales bacterium]|nr:alcohol dehydrogenase catalytic domain-containing protein [Thermoanaerobacterales bacterium]